jgi:hypothetical protein
MLHRRCRKCGTGISPREKCFSGQDICTNCALENPMTITRKSGSITFYPDLVGPKRTQQIIKAWSKK